MGIFNGKLRRTEFDIDLKEITEGSGDGLLALVGTNGSGKSTILESLHPFRKSFSKNLKFKDLFLNQTGLKELFYEIKGEKYKFRIELKDGKLISSSVSKFSKTGKEILLTDGKARSYEKEVRKLFGSPEIFFKTFYRNGEKSFISDLDRNEKKRHFLQILDLEKLGNINTNIVNEKIKALSKLINSEQASIKTLYDQQKDKDEETFLLEIKDLKDKIKKIEQEKLEVEIEINNLNKRKDQVISAENDIIQKQGKINTYREKINTLEEKQKEINKEGLEVSNQQKKLEKEIEIINKDLTEKTDILNRYDQLLNNNGKDLEEKYIRYKDLKTLHDDLVRKQLAVVDSFQEIRIYQERKKHLVDNIAEKKSKVKTKNSNGSEICATCEILLEQATLLKEITDLEETLKNSNFDEQITIQQERSNTYNTIQDEIDTFNEEYLFLLNSNTEKDYEDYKDIKQKYAEARFVKNEADLEKSNKESKLQELFNKTETLMEKETDIDNQKEDIRKDIAEIEKEISALKLIKFTPKDLEEKEFEKESLRVDLENSNSSLSFKTAEYQNFTNIQNRIVEHDAVFLSLSSEREDWEKIKMAFDEKTGIPYLELKGACKGIADIANNLLKSIELPFTVEFVTETTKDKKTKRDEGHFDIDILRTGGMKVAINLLSNGEKVMVETAISLASIIFMNRKRESGIEIMLLDEMDGALHKDNLKTFFDLIRNAHKISKCKQTIFITHNIEHLGPCRKIKLDPSDPLKKGYRIE